MQISALFTVTVPFRFPFPITQKLAEGWQNVAELGSLDLDLSEKRLLWT